MDFEIVASTLNDNRGDMKVSKELPWHQRPWTTIWISCVISNAVTNHPSSADTSSMDWNSDHNEYNNNTTIWISCVIRNAVTNHPSSADTSSMDWNVDHNEYNDTTTIWISCVIRNAVTNHPSSADTSSMDWNVGHIEYNGKERNIIKSEFESGCM